MAASLQAAATTFMQPNRLGVQAQPTMLLRPSQSVYLALGVEQTGARVTCSLQADFKDLDYKCADAAKVAGFALATSALCLRKKNLP